MADENTEAKEEIIVKDAVETPAVQETTAEDEISPEAIGLFLVLLTLRSKLRSKISLITQPAERINIDPIKNNPTIFVKLTEWLNLYARAAPNKQGKNNNQIPIGLFKRERLRYESSINVVLQILHRFLLYLPPQGILS